MANPIVTGITQYVEENRSELIAKSLLGSKSAKLFTIMDDVKGPTSLNLVDTDVVLQAGGCGWTESGSTALSQRILTPKSLKVNHSFCPENILKSWKNYELRVKAGAENLPFEQKFSEGIINGVDEAVEKMIYQGASGQTNQFEGLISILTADVPTGNTYSATAGTDAYVAIKATYAKLPARAKKEDTVILVSDQLYDAFIQDLVEENHYHFTPNEGAERQMFLPGTNVKVVAVPGLNDSASYEYIIVARRSNIFYGVSAEEDSRALDMWYSKDAQEFRAKVAFIAGVQVAYPDEIAFGKVARS